jgi:uncharacterized protein YqgV (UPF0045/DUF77 family)
MLAQFSIWPLVGAVVKVTTAHTISEALDGLEVKYEVGSMGTTIEGDWDQVMAAILVCHQAVAARHSRVLTNITIDDEREPTISPDEAVSQAQKVEAPEAETSAQKNTA